MYEVSQVISGTMVYVCWVNEADIPIIWILKFIEQTATNMLAVTNLGICVNLALIVSVSACQSPFAIWCSSRRSVVFHYI